MRGTRLAAFVLLTCVTMPSASAREVADRRLAGRVVVGSLLVAARGAPVDFVTIAAEARPLGTVHWLVRTCRGADGCVTRSETLPGAIVENGERVMITASSGLVGDVRLSATGVRPEPAVASCRVGWTSADGDVSVGYEGEGYAARVTWTGTVGGRRVSPPRGSGCGWYVALGAVTVSGG